MNGPPPPNEDSGDTPPASGNERNSSNDNNFDHHNVRDHLNFIMQEIQRRDGIVHVIDLLDMDRNLFGDQQDQTSPAQGPPLNDHILQIVRRVVAEQQQRGSPPTGPAGASTAAPPTGQADADPQTPHSMNENVFFNFGANRWSVRGGDGPSRVGFVPRTRPGTIYFISIQEEDENQKASQRALDSLKRIPLAEVPVGERDCTICYEPLTEYKPVSPQESQESQASSPQASQASDSLHSSSSTSSSSSATQAASSTSDEDHSPLAIPGCNHFFGASCLHSWLQSASSCPLCRSKLESESDQSGPRSRFGNSMPFFFDRLRTRDPDHGPAASPAAAASSSSSAEGESSERNNDRSDNPSVDPQAQSEFDREVTEMLHGLIAPPEPAQNEERGAALIHMIIGVLRHLANRATSEPAPPGAGAGTTEIVNNLNNTMNVAAQPPNAPLSSATNAPSDTPAPRAETQGTNPSSDSANNNNGPFGLRQFIRFPLNPIPSFAELRSRQSEVMRRALDQSWLRNIGSNNVNSDNANSDANSNSTSNSTSNSNSTNTDSASVMSSSGAESQDTTGPQPTQGPAATVTIHIPHPVLLSTPLAPPPTTNPSVPTSEEENVPGDINMADTPIGSGSSEDLSSTNVTPRSATPNEDGEERRSGPSRRQGNRHHPYQRNP